jgi:hypothetical protein
MSCQVLRKASDSNRNNAADDSFLKSVQTSIEAGQFPAPLATVQDLGLATAKTISSDELKRWIDSEPSLHYAPTRSGTQTTTPAISNEGSTMSSGMKCAWDAMKKIVVARKEMVAIVTHIDAQHCDAEYRKDAEKTAADWRTDEASSTAGVSLAISYPINLKEVWAMRCAGADLSRFNGVEIAKINDISDSSDPTFLAIIKDCSFQNDMNLLKNWSTSRVANYREFSFKKSADKSFTKGEMLTISRRGTTNSSNGACERTQAGNDLVLGDCVRFESRTILEKSGTQNTESQPNSAVVRGKNLHWRSGTFYISGNVEFESDNWKGSMDYVDSDRAPTWVAKNNLGENVSGRVAPPANSSPSGFNLFRVGSP